MLRRNSLGTSINSFGKKLFDECCSCTFTLCCFKKACKKRKNQRLSHFSALCTSLPVLQSCWGTLCPQWHQPVRLAPAQPRTDAARQLRLQPGIDFSLQTWITVTEHTVCFVLFDPTSLAVSNTHLWHRNCRDQSSLSARAEQRLRTSRSPPGPDGAERLRTSRTIRVT